MDNAELISRIAATLKKEIGPAVDDNFPKTQAFMASVVLQKISGELASAEQHREAERLDRELLLNKIKDLIAQHKPPKAILDSASVLVAEASDENLCRFIEALYANRADLGEPAFTGMLGCVRTSLRASIDRRMEYSR